MATISTHLGRTRPEDGDSRPGRVLYGRSVFYSTSSDETLGCFTLDGVDIYGNADHLTELSDAIRLLADHVRQAATEKDEA